MALFVAASSVSAEPSSRDLPPVALRPLLAGALAHAQGAFGLTAIVMRRGRHLYRLDIGQVARDQQLMIASASKWLTSALLMTLVDKQEIALDDPISKILPAFRGDSAKTTLRELLAQTAGEGSVLAFFDINQNPRMTLRQSAEQIAARPLVHPPGTVFDYGGPQFQVAGAMAEAVTGKRWARLFDERISSPLGMTHTYWLHINRQTRTPADAVPAAETLNPLLQGGAVTTAADYMRFLTMLQAGGLFHGRRVLSQNAVDEMETMQTRHVKMGFVPPTIPAGSQYALGNWCNRWEASGRCTLVSSQGAFGTFPWIDRKTGLYGIFFIKAPLRDVADAFEKAQAMIINTNR
jgi:CubicO group peptidase (beta-lactamase class C family)